MSQDDETIRKKARDLLQSGRLPARRPDDVWAVTGSGQDRCMVCGDLVAPHEFAIEAEFRGTDGSSSVCFHVGCYWTLESERRRVEAASDPTDHPGRPRLAGGVDCRGSLESNPE